MLKLSFPSVFLRSNKDGSKTSQITESHYCDQEEVETDDEVFLDNSCSIINKPTNKDDYIKNLIYDRVRKVSFRKNESNTLSPPQPPPLFKPNLPPLEASLSIPDEESSFQAKKETDKDPDTNIYYSINEMEELRLRNENNIKPFKTISEDVVNTEKTKTSPNQIFKIKIKSSAPKFS